MGTYITTIRFTEQGIRNVQDTCKRADAFKAAARKMDVKVRDIYWMLGPDDGMLVFEAPDDETATAAMLHLGTLGNVSTQTARAYKTAEMKEILGKMPQ